MKIKRFALLFLFCGLFISTAGQQNSPSFTGIELQPTVAYLRYHGGAARMARLVFHGGTFQSGGVVYVDFQGLRDSIVVPASAAGLMFLEVPLPGAPVLKEMELTVALRSDGSSYVARCLVSPARMWRVYLLPHSHVDVGYTNVQEKVLKIHMNNIDEAIEIGKRTEGYPAEAQYKWNTEAIWVVDHYLALADEQKRQRFWDAVKKGWINLDGSYGNVNTSAESGVQLLHQFDHGVRLAKAHGVEVETMFQGDVPGASWGLVSQSAVTGIRYFLSAPNSSDRIGSADLWRDHPFYWLSPSGKDKLLFWQCSPYSIGYALKGDKIPNFFTVEDPKPFYTGKPSDNFLNPYLFHYLAGLEQKGFPYNMTLLTWAMSDNAPIDPELPDAVKAWNERYASPKLVVTATKQFFRDFEATYKDQIPTVSGDYTEYWTDGIASGARETGMNRNAADRLQQATAIWALRGKDAYPVERVDSALTDMVMFNEHTWGAYNSVSRPEDLKAVSQWKYKQAFALGADRASKDLLKESVAGGGAEANGMGAAAVGNGNGVWNGVNMIDVYNTLGQERTDLAVVPAALSSAGDLVKDSRGNRLISQRLSTGELAILVSRLAPFSKERLTIQAGKAIATGSAQVMRAELSNGVYRVGLDSLTGNIVRLEKAGVGLNLADTVGLNQYAYLVDDSADKVQYASNVRIAVREHGPLVVSLVVVSDAPGAHWLEREVRLVSGVDRVDIINTIDKKAVGAKEGVHFMFPFRIPGARVRYSIPWGSVVAEEDQLKYANRNWYTVQRWVDVSNKEVGVTWSTPDAPLFEIGRFPTAGLLGGLEGAPQWIGFTDQQPLISSWVMNNLWHTNFRRDQEGVTRFRYSMQVHGKYDGFRVNNVGLADHQPLVVAAACGPAVESLFFSVRSEGVYVENIQPAQDGKGVVLQVVNAWEHACTVRFGARDGGAALRIWQSDLQEGYGPLAGDVVDVPAKGVMMLRVALQ